MVVITTIILCIKFIIFLFIGSFSIFAGEIKSEENCYYSTRREYRKCKKEGRKLVPKYPIENFHTESFAMGEGVSSVNHSAVGSVYKVIEFKAYEKDKLQISSGTKSVGFMYGLSWRNAWINKTTFKINTERIITLYKKDEPLIGGWPNTFLPRKYNFKYLDEYGEVKSIKFDNLLESTKRRGVDDMIGDYLLFASNLKWGEERSVEFLIENILNDNEKFLTITKSIILKENSSSNDCFEAKDSKFPELTTRYKKLYKTINPLRAKLDLPPSTDLKPICN